MNDDQQDLKLADLHAQVGQARRLLGNLNINDLGADALDLLVPKILARRRVDECKGSLEEIVKFAQGMTDFGVDTPKDKLLRLVIESMFDTYESYIHADLPAEMTDDQIDAHTSPKFRTVTDLLRSQVFAITALDKHITSGVLKTIELLRHTNANGDYSNLRTAFMFNQLGDLVLITP